MTHYQAIKYRKTVKHILMVPLISLLTGLTIAFSQGSATTQSGQSSDQSSIHEEEIFTVVEVHPEFPGGMSRFQDYIRKNLRYPEEAVKAKVEAKVFVSFIIQKDGSIREAHVLKGRGYGMDEEAVRLVQSMPNWIPGKQAGRAVNVKYNIVIPFRLSDAK